MPLVEVVPHPGTNTATIATAIDFYNSLGRKAIHIQQEAPGFVANRLQAALLTEAYSLVSRGVISAEDLGKFSSVQERKHHQQNTHHRPDETTRPSH
jgi:3-hydroxyacyl-CoA dehydrogenase